MSINVVQLQAAYHEGRKLATKEYKEHGLKQERDVVFEQDTEIQDMTFKVTGEKLTPGSDDSWSLQESFENGYYGQWEDNLV